MIDLNRKWFRAKDYGWGWAPATWEGWALTATWALAIITDFIWVDSQTHSISDTLANFIPHTVVISGLYLVLVVFTGEKPRWKWDGEIVPSYVVLRETAILIGFILLAHFAGVLGAVATTAAIPTWYVDIAKPLLTPPNWLFGPVWAILYTLMGGASYILYRHRAKKGALLTLLLYAAHLGVNALWSFVFFGLKNPEAAQWILMLLIVMVAWLSMRMYRYSKVAAAFLVPYLLWLCFAMYLNTSISLLN